MEVVRLQMKQPFLRVLLFPFSSSLGFRFWSAGAFAQTPRLLNSFHYRKVRPVTEDTVNPLEKVGHVDKGALHVVSVPIGNLKDFTYRAVEVLREVDYIITSDRPATKTLLDLVQIPNQGRLVHYSPQNKAMTCEKLVEMLRGGRSMALVTTSGTPCIGDIGAELVQAMLRSGVRVTSVPGASPLLAALTCCGETRSPHEHSSECTSQSDRSMKVDDYPGLLGDFLLGSFFFGNMLPSSHSARLRVLRNVVGPATHPCVFYEIPRRLVLTLEDIASVLPGRKVYITHELTKLNESIHADQVEKLLIFYRRMEAQPLIKLGQLVLVISGATPQCAEKWMQKITERRRRFRPNIIRMLASVSSSSPPFSSETKGELQSEFSSCKAGVQRKLKKKKRKRKDRGAPTFKGIASKGTSENFFSAKRLQREMRLKELQNIEEAQESLRLSMLANRVDSQKFS